MSNGIEAEGRLICEGSVDFFSAPHGFFASELRLTDDKLRSELLAMEHGSFLLDAASFSDLSDKSAVGRVIEDEDFEKGRHKNSHGLEFGQLVLSSFWDLERQEFVAIKPLETPKAAIHEFAVNHYVNGFGDPRRKQPLGYKPLGFYRFEKGGDFALVTEYDESVTSYDNTFWDPENRPTEPQVQKALARCAMGLARLHGFGLTHGDAQVKNMAVDNNGVRFIDLETAAPFPAKRGAIDAGATRYSIERDIRTFVNSLNSGIDAEPTDYSPELKIAFSENYVDAIRHPSSRIPEAARLGIDDIIDLIAT